MSDPQDRLVSEPLDRRSFLSRSGSALGSAWVLSMLPLLQACAESAREAEAEGAALRFFTPEEHAAAEALTGRIIPTDETPGAKEARVARFMDQAFADQLLPGMDQGVRGALQMADGLARERGADGVASLDDAGIDEILGVMAGDPSSPFGALYAATMMGMFSNPEYGGNADEVGWRLLGHERAASFEPPFGHYDRIYRENGGQL